MTTRSRVWNKKRILVTGGAGFIGSRLVNELTKWGAEVSVIDNLWRGNIDNLKDRKGAFMIDMERQFIQADLADYEACLVLIKSFDLVYHLADIVAGINYVFGHESFIFNRNVLINTNTLNACINNGIRDYIYVGTACSYPKHLQMRDGIVQLKESQTYPAEPESAYGWSKLMGEYEALLAEKEGRIRLGLLRFHNVYGPGSVYSAEMSQVIPSLIRKAINYPREPFIVFGNGSQYRDFVYIDDIIEALLLVAEKGIGRGLIQIGTEKPVTISEVAETVVTVSGKQIPIVFDESGPTGDRGRIADCALAREVLGWKPKTDFRRGIENLYGWIAEKIREVEAKS